MNNTFTKEDELNLLFLLHKAMHCRVIEKHTYNYATNELREYFETTIKTNLPIGNQTNSLTKETK